jgi:hypothetical protein
MLRNGGSNQNPIISVTAQKGIAQKYLEHLWSSLRPFSYTYNTVSGTEGSMQIPL